MKAILILILLCAVGGIVLYFQGGYASLDPNQQGIDAKKAITPGMTLTKVVAAAGAPRKYSQFHKVVEKVMGREVETIKTLAKINFNVVKVLDRISNDDLPDGFVVHYRFSESVAFDVHFDNTGNVTDIEDAMTMADLLQYK